MFKTLSATVFGIDAHLVEVEVDLNPSRSDWNFTTVGLPDAAVKESRDRKAISRSRLLIKMESTG